MFHSIPLSFANRLPIIFLHHPLLGNQTETSITFGCGYLTIRVSSGYNGSTWMELNAHECTHFILIWQSQIGSLCIAARVN
jgi:hypothetical protein